MSKSNKASNELLEKLHNNVAMTLLDNLDDPKFVQMAIKFLADNDIRATLEVEGAGVSIQEAIKQLAKESGDSKPLTIEELMLN